MKKNGITVFALLLTIVVALIIVSASIISISNVIYNSRISDFTERMQLLENQVMLYYIENSTIPKLDDTVYNKTEVISIINNYNEINLETEFNEELSLNGDSTATAFYKLDLTKIGVTRFSSTDEYVIAIPSLHVYSLYVMEAKNQKYFSLSSKINSNSIIRQNTITYNENNQIFSTNGVKVSQKNSNTWSNKLKLSIQSFIDSGENLYVKFNDKEVLVETTESKDNIIYFDSLVKSDENGLNASLFSEANFNDSDMTLLSSLDVKDKFIEIIKKDSSSNIIATVKTYLFNFDYKAPSVTSLNNSVTVGTDKNTLEFYVEDNESGIKEVRYEYFSTYDRTDGNEGRTSYYSLDKITRKYLVYNGKVAKSDASGKVSIEIPKGISSIKAVIIDNASNISDAVELGTEGQNEIYYSASNITNNSLDIKFYGVGLVSGTFTYSTNNSSYSNSIPFNPSQNVNLTNVGSAKGKLYIKVTSGRVDRLIEINLPNESTNGTSIKNESSSNNPYIPNGFIHTEGTISTGFVIQDVSENTATKYNEFVWIPVDGKEVGYGKYEFGIGTIASFQNILIDNKDSFNEASTFEAQIKESIERYGGFYVARYEASLDESSNLRSIRNAAVINSTSYQNAIDKSNAMYQNRSDIASTLMNAACFDTIIKYLSISKYNVTTVSEYNSMLGNFSGSIIKTGSNNNYVMNNIYDLAGNVAELTTETYKGNPVFRGGSFSSAVGENRVCSVRAYNSTSVEQLTIGFRPILFIK